MSTPVRSYIYQFGLVTRIPDFVAGTDKLAHLLSLISAFLIRSLYFIKNTVNPEIFARVLFSRNFAYAKFGENKILAKWRNHSVVYSYR